MLGTLPGEESLRRIEYYAHKRNLFWPIVFALFGEKPDAQYEKRLAFVAAQRIALWDVCAVAERRASLDPEIKREAPNPRSTICSTPIPVSLQLPSMAKALGAFTTGISSAGPA